MAKPRLILFADPKRPNAVKAMEEFLHFVQNKADILANCLAAQCPLDDLNMADFAIVFGGDGTILGAARMLCETKVPVIGVNVGKLGFLAEFSLEELKNLFDRIIEDRSLVEQRMVLVCDLHHLGNTTHLGKAVNDLVITSGSPFNMIEVNINVNDQLLAGSVGDGLIVSTPTGSTAYNLSAGGPILSAGLSAMVITPVCPHSLSFRPIVIDADSRVQIAALRTNTNTTVLLDGDVRHKLDQGDMITVREHNGKFLVVNNPVRTQWDTLATKLKWAEKPRYA